jgi:hypothetical protein
MINHSLWRRHIQTCGCSAMVTMGIIRLIDAVPDLERDNKVLAARVFVLDDISGLNKLSSASD